MKLTAVGRQSGESRLSTNNFHSLYVAPLVVGLLTATVLAVASYFFAPPPAVSPAAAQVRVQPSRPASGEGLVGNPDLPKDAATRSLLQEFLTDPAAGIANHQGKEVQICAVIAMIDPSGVIELYGAKGASSVEGLYFKCTLRQGDALEGIDRNQLVMLKGTVTGYVHHRRSPYIIVEDCRLSRS